MRIALILLSILAMIFIGSVSWSLIKQEGWTMKSKGLASTNIDSITLETWKNQIKTDEKIEKLSALVQELSGKNTNMKQEIPVGSTGSQTLIKISGKLLELIMPTMTLTLVENSGIFDLFIFDTYSQYSTYTDPKYGLKVIPLTLSYETLLKNLRALAGNPYIVNETKTFPFRSFYLNPERSDTLVRLIIEIETQAIALEIPKNKFPLLKDILSGKTHSEISSKKK